jgi:hypothetical protein
MEFAVSNEHLALIVVGVAYGGGEARFDALCASPALGAPTQRAPHFVDDETQDWARPDDGDHHARFDAPAERLMGEVTSDDP